VLVFAGLFATVWWSWASSTLYANRFDHDDALYRLYKLASMGAVIGLAATAARATGSGLGVFAGCSVALRLFLLLQYLRVYRSVEQVRPVARLYAGTLALGALLWGVSIVVPRPLCFALWGAALAVEVLAPLLATGSATDVPLHLEHLPERFALFVILVLGESVAAVVNGLQATGWSVAAVAVGAACFAVAAGLWWSYFDLAGAAAKRLLNDVGGRRSVGAHDVYVFGQLPLCLSLAAVGAGVQLAVTDSGRGTLPPGTRMLIAGGVAVYLATVSLTNSGMAGTWRGGWWWPLSAAAVAALDTVLELPAVVTVGALAALLVVVVLVGTVHRSTGRLAVDPL
jgi:low temperature requirement protein LtrA